MTDTLTNNNTMNNDKYSITPGQDKFEPVDHSLLRLHIADLSRPIRRSNYAVPTNHRRANDGIAASLVLALAILTTVAVVIWATK